VDLADARYIAEELMAEFGLTEQGWSFAFDGARRRAGCCHFGPKRITLSRVLAETQPEDFIFKVVAHEIAHAHAGPSAGHGPLWRAYAQVIGCDATSCYDSDDLIDHPALARRWTITCPTCGHTTQRDRKTSRETACARCCRIHNGGEFDRRFLLQWERNTPADVPDPNSGWVRLPDDWQPAEL
jgi:predicted SprT family Zn-dependent metalloprotease